MADHRLRNRFGLNGRALMRGKRLAVSRQRICERSADPQQAFPGHGQMKPEQLEIDKLRREVAKLKRSAIS